MAVEIRKLVEALAAFAIWVATAVVRLVMVLLICDKALRMPVVRAMVTG